MCGQNLQCRRRYMLGSSDVVAARHKGKTVPVHAVKSYGGLEVRSSTHS